MSDEQVNKYFVDSQRQTASYLMGRNAIGPLTQAHPHHWQETLDKENASPPVAS
jgi:hypothetical protein